MSKSASFFVFSQLYASAFARGVCAYELWLEL